MTVLKELMDERDIGVRALARTTGRYSHTYMSALGRGTTPPTAENMRVIAAALEVDPRVFREYRQHLAVEKARQLAGELEPDVVLDALRRLNGGRPQPS